MLQGAQFYHRLGPSHCFLLRTSRLQRRRDHHSIVGTTKGRLIDKNAEPRSKRTAQQSPSTFRMKYENARPVFKAKPYPGSRIDTCTIFTNSDNSRPEARKLYSD